MPHWSLMTSLVPAFARHRVLQGPFTGTKLLLSGASGRLLQCYTLGTWELEIQGAIERLAARNYATIVNVGAADGYYSAGFARRMPNAQVLAFEANSELHDIIARTAAANGVADRVQIAGYCDGAALRETLARAKPPILVLADIEGYEAQLLDPIALPALHSVDLLIETHDAAVPRCTELLISRFRSTHAVERFVARPRELRDFPPGFLPLLPKLFPSAAVELMNERRTGTQQWLCCHSRTRALASQGTPAASRAETATAR